MDDTQIASSIGSDHRSPSLTLDVVQDHPAHWDWRLVLGFVFAGAIALYLS